ncbi:NFACT family protein [Candidatus Latescibacterota bacterium]
MDYYTICAQRTLLSRMLIGETVETIRLHERNLFLDFEGETALKLACIPDMPYLYTLEKRFTPMKKSRDWYPTLLKGRILKEISLIHGDRVLTFTFDSGIRLIFEMTGRHANIILMDKEGTITGVIRKITSRESGVREIRPGIPYIPPPAREFPDPVWSPLPVLDRRLREAATAVDKALALTVCSGSKLFAREALALSEINPSLVTTELSSGDVFQLLKTVAELADRIEKGGEGGTVICGVDGLPRDVFPLPMMSAETDKVYQDDINEAVRTYARERECGLEKRSLKTFVSAVLAREEKSLRNTLRKIERERGRFAEPGLLTQKGNTILANLHLVEKGMTFVNLPDPYGDGEVEIELDPALDGHSNAERFFTRSRKLRAAGKMAEERISTIEQRIETIRSERKRIETLDEIKELKQLATAYARKAAREHSADEDQRFPRRFMSISGLEIIVGRNDRENDELLHWARKNDLWLHAQSVRGSHVILRTPGKKQQPDHTSIEQAASIAAYYSKAKTSAVAPVVCTQVKYVVKRRGQGPGQVTYTREKVIFVEPGLIK